MTQDSNELGLAMFLVERGMLTPGQLQQALEISNSDETPVDFERVLLDRNFINAVQLGEAKAALRKGRTDLIHGYEILSKIGQGGMGIVYKARQISLDRIVAIKILLPKIAGDPSAVQRFLGESKVIAKLSHPNLVAGIDAGFQHGLYYCVMEYIEGKTLTRVLNIRNPLPWKEALTIARQIAAALGHAQGRGIVHRDVKPDNIIIDGAGVAKLMDLGLARLTTPELKGPHSTDVGQVAGTPMYMSPEQAVGKTDIDCRSDIYSLGLTLYEMLCGHAPFEGSAPMEVAAQRLNEDVRPEPLREAGVPVPILAILRKMTARERDQRYPTPADLIEDLDAAMRDKPLPHVRYTTRSSIRQTRIVVPSGRRKSAAPAVVLGVVAAAGLVALGVILTSGPSRRAPPPAPVVRDPEPLPVPAPAPPPIEVQKPPSRDFESAWQAVLAVEADLKEKNPEAALAAFLDAREALKGTPRSGDLARRIAEARAPIEDAVRQERKRVESAIDLLLAAGKFDEASRELQAASKRFESARLREERDLPEYAGWPAAVKALEAKVRERLDALAGPLRESARALRKQGRFDEAAQEYEKMKKLGVESLASEAAAELAKTAEEKESRSDEQAVKAKKDEWAIEDAWKAARTMAQSRNYDGAAKRLEETRASLAASPHRASIEELCRDMELARSVIRDSGKEDGPTEQIVPAYRAAKRSAQGADSNKALFLFALFEGDDVTAEKELQALKAARVAVRPEYQDLWERVQSRGNDLRSQKKEAADKIKDADRKFLNPKTREEALKAYTAILEAYSDVLPESTISNIRARLSSPPPPPVPSGSAVTIDASQMRVSGQVKKGRHDKSPLKDVVILGADSDRTKEHCAEFTFDAKAGVAYKLWLHMSYFGQDKNSVVVSMEGDVTISGKIGETVSDVSYVIQYYPKSDEQGFGWTDRDMTARDEAERTIDLESSPGPSFQYATAGPKKIRIYNREAGTMVDRALISPDRFLRQIPGASELQPRK